MTTTSKPAARQKEKRKETPFLTRSVGTTSPDDQLYYAPSVHE
mgnify:CR=1 FL=1